MHEAVQQACSDAGAKMEQIKSLFVGMAGVVTTEDRSQSLERCRNWPLAENCIYGVDHDIRIALQGGLSGRPGIALIAGTGSSCYGRNDLYDFWQAGGWDRILDDLGSGYDLAQKGMAAACQSADGRLKKSLLESCFFGALGTTNVSDFSQKVHRPGMARHEIAALAPLVLKAAEKNDAAAVQIVTAGANELARMVEAVSDKLFPQQNPEVVPIGGLIEKSESYRHYVTNAILARLPRARLTTAELRPAVGALALAAAQVKHPVDLKHLQLLSAQAKE